MNTVTLVSGIKRQFALPAAIVLSAHAALFFGFWSHPPSMLVKAFPPHQTPSYIPFDLAEETPVADGDAAQSRSSQAPPSIPEIPCPLSPVESRRIEIQTPSAIPVGICGAPVGTPWPGTGRGPTHGDVFTPSMLDHTPEAAVQVQPIYPYEAKAKMEGGTVVIEFTVDTTGRVLNPHVITSTDSIFNEPTLRAIEQWRFKPGKRNGTPVRFRMSLPIHYNISEDI